MHWFFYGLTVVAAFLVGAAIGGLLLAAWAAAQIEDEYEDRFPDEA